MNRGDTVQILLQYTVEGEAIQEGEFDEIEFSIGSKRFTLTDGGIVWDSEQAAYTIALSQEDTIALPGVQPYQIRFKKDDTVISSDIDTVEFGNSISKVIL